MEEAAGRWKSASRAQIGEHFPRIFLLGQLQPWGRNTGISLLVPVRGSLCRYLHVTGGCLPYLDPCLVGVRGHGKGTGRLLITVSIILSYSGCNCKHGTWLRAGRLVTVMKREKG